MNTPGCETKVKAWTPAVRCKISDNIVSSNYTTAKIFVPSYERETRPCMEQLLTNEYQRMWWQEKEAWDKRFATKVPSKKLVQREVIRRKPPTSTTTNLQPKKNKPRKKEIKKVTEN